jgi:hypothetical protein
MQSHQVRLRLTYQMDYGSSPIKTSHGPPIKPSYWSLVKSGRSHDEVDRSLCISTDKLDKRHIALTRAVDSECRAGTHLDIRITFGGFGRRGDARTGKATHVKPQRDRERKLESRTSLSMVMRRKSRLLLIYRRPQRLLRMPPPTTRSPKICASWNEQEAETQATGLNGKKGESQTTRL